MAYTIEARGLTKAFGATRVLEGLDLAVRPGEVFALLGPNGAGKTTTVRILSTLLSLDDGIARVAGHDVTTDREAVRRKISLTAQEAAVDGVLTGAENLRMMARLRRVKNAGQTANELLERFDLAEAADRRVATYSGGMRRRLDLAMSLISKPEVIFLDEPSTGLDPRSRLAIWEAVQALADGGATILLTTQYLEEADRLADRIAVVNGGRIAAEGTAEELKSRVGEETLELHFAHEDHLRRARERVAGRRDGLSLHVPTQSPDDVRRVLDALGDIRIDRLDLHKPTLDDVFLALT